MVRGLIFLRPRVPPWSVEEQDTCFVVLPASQDRHVQCLMLRANCSLLEHVGNPAGSFRLSYGTEPNDPMPFILTLTPHYVARAIGKTEPTDIQNYAEQNADKLKGIATFEKARGFTTHTLE